VRVDEAAALSDSGAVMQEPTARAQKQAQTRLSQMRGGAFFLLLDQGLEHGGTQFLEFFRLLAPSREF